MKNVFEEAVWTLQAGRAWADRLDTVPVARQTAVMAAVNWYWNDDGCPAMTLERMNEYLTRAMITPNPSVMPQHGDVLHVGGGHSVIIRKAVERYPDGTWAVMARNGSQYVARNEADNLWSIVRK